MQKYVEFVRHLSTEEIRERYRECSNSVEKIRWLFVLCMSEGYRIKRAVEALGWGHTWGTQMLARWNRFGPDGLADGRRRPHRHGLPALLNAEQRQRLAKVLTTEPPPDGGWWTGRKVAQWVAKETHAERVWRQRGWELLLELGFSAIKPRPEHVESDPEARETFKKKRCRTPPRR